MNIQLDECPQNDLYDHHLDQEIKHYQVLQCPIAILHILVTPPPSTRGDQCAGFYHIILSFVPLFFFLTFMCSWLECCFFFFVSYIIVTRSRTQLNFNFTIVSIRQREGRIGCWEETPTFLPFPTLWHT